MARREDTLQALLRGTSDKDINFEDLRALSGSLGFQERIRGDHHIFSHSQVTEIINIRPVGATAKANQVRQVRNLIAKYKLGENI